LQKDSWVAEQLCQHTWYAGESAKIAMHRCPILKYIAQTEHTAGFPALANVPERPTQFAAGPQRQVIYDQHVWFKDFDHFTQLRILFATCLASIWVSVNLRAARQ
jgi:hypothetical protein